MRKYEVITVPEQVIPKHEKRECLGVFCDMCDEKIQSDDGDSGYEFKEIEIRYEKGSRYPGCGNSVEESVDLCVTCFKDKLTPWLKEQGVEPNIEENVW